MKVPAQFWPPGGSKLSKIIMTFTIYRALEEGGLGFRIQISNRHGIQDSDFKQGGIQDSYFSRRGQYPTIPISTNSISHYPCFTDWYPNIPGSVTNSPPIFSDIPISPIWSTRALIMKASQE